MPQICVWPVMARTMVEAGNRVKTSEIPAKPGRRGRAARVI
jgi:hypothetical protein